MNKSATSGGCAVLVLCMGTIGGWATALLLRIPPVSSTNDPIKIHFDTIPALAGLLVGILSVAVSDAALIALARRNASTSALWSVGLLRAGIYLLFAVGVAQSLNSR